MINLKDDISRLMRIKGADYGYFVVAMHSLIERTLRELYPELDTDIMSFNTAINRFKDDLYKKYTINGYLSASDRQLIKEINELKVDHELTHKVRHRYESLDKQILPAHVKNFYSFAKAMDWTKDSSIDQIRNLLTVWDSRSSYDRDLLDQKRQELDELLIENKNLREQASLYVEQKDLLEKEKEKLHHINEKLSIENKKTKEIEKEFNILSTDNKRIHKYLDYLQTISMCSRTRHDYEQSIIRLSQEQQNILNKINLNSDYLIKGSAGTGKSLVLLKTIEKGIQDKLISLNNFRLLTFNKTLTRYNEYVTELLGIEVPINTVSTADLLLKNMLLKVFGNKLDNKNPIIYNFRDFDSSLFESETFDRYEVFIEADKFIWANLITKDDYINDKIPRRGMKKQLKIPEREKLWNDLQITEKLLENQNRWPRLFAAKVLNDFIDNNPTIAEDLGLFVDYSFIDEVQDLPPVMVSLIKKTTRKSIFLAGDSDQSIYLKGLSRFNTGVNISHSTYTLTKNYRNSVAIHDIAEKYRLTIPNRKQTNYCTADNIGVSVNYVEKQNLGDIYTIMLNDIRLYLNALATVPENICIICPKKGPLETMKNRIEKELNVSTVFIDESINFAQAEGIKLCTMQSCKGLDFPLVMILIPDNKIPLPIEGLDDNTRDEQEHNLIYVSLTRAMEMLDIYMVRERNLIYPEALNDLSEVLTAKS